MDIAGNDSGPSGSGEPATATGRVAIRRLAHQAFIPGSENPA